MKNTRNNRVDILEIKKSISYSLDQSALCERIRSEYIDIIMKNNVTHANNILKLSDWLHYIMFCKIVNRLKPNLDSIILDWGGLYGHVTQILRSTGYKNCRNYLLYIPPSYKLFTDRFGIPTTFGSDPVKINADDASVDIFISSGTLEHALEDQIGKEEHIMAEIHRVLRPEGLFFIWNLPAMLGTSELLAMVANKWRHKYRFWKNDVVVMCETAGFEIVCMDKHKFLPGSIMEILGKKFNPLVLLALDDWFSHIFPFNIFARDFLVVATKPARQYKGNM